MLWTLGVLAVFLTVGGFYLYSTLSTNGPRLISAADRVISGDRGAAELASITTGPHPAQKLHVWGPVNRNPDDAALPVLLFAHGGGWRSGDPDGYGFLARSFVPKGFIVVLSGYRLGEDGIYPGMLEDTANAIAWTHEEIAFYGGDPDRIVIAGHSAGAYNVVHIALEEQWLGRRGLSTSDISGVVGMAGPYDFAPFDSDSTIAAFGHVEDAASTQPINFVREDAPQMLLVHGEKDTLVRARNSRLLAELLNEAGANALTAIEPEMDHNGPLIALATAFRGDSDLVEVISAFAYSVTAPDDLAAETSVPVQAETR
ncbi:alpha/beta hydrolase [uncultured Erythrobacter sp.]|uniref:alpha/beta hydrolase n=1 Tax=uncultured Erythrobacter sp. TaxID=263913 RepID=UPI002617F2CD|nr:alpha/beta hydrolase [uncultured Erythrobacter sp.]